MKDNSPLYSAEEIANAIKKLGTGTAVDCFASPHDIEDDYLKYLWHQTRVKLEEIENYLKEKGYEV